MRWSVVAFAVVAVLLVTAACAKATPTPTPAATATPTPLALQAESLRVIENRRLTFEAASRPGGGVLWASQDARVFIHARGLSAEDQLVRSRCPVAFCAGDKWSLPALDIWSIAADGSRDFLVRTEATPKVTSSGRYLVYADSVGCGEDDAFLLSLSVLDLQTRQSRSLTEAPIRQGNTPVWIVPGSDAVLVAREDGLWRFDLSTGKASKAYDVSGGSVRQALPSPDGQSVLYKAEDYETKSRLVSVPDGTGYGFIEDNTRTAIAAWAPGGSRFAYWEKQPDEAGYALHMVTLAEGKMEDTVLIPISSLPGGVPGGLVWSPGGDVLAFPYMRMDEEASNPQSAYRIVDLYVVNADGTGLRRLVEEAIRTPWLSGPRWSEDGGAIFYEDVATSELWGLVVDEGAAASLPAQPVSLSLRDRPGPVASNRYVYLEPEDVADDVKLHASPEALAAEGMKLVHTASDLAEAVGGDTEWVLIHRDTVDEVDGEWLRQEMEAGHAIMGLWMKANDLRELMGLVPITDIPAHPLAGDWVHSYVKGREGGTPSSGEGSGTLQDGVLTMSQLANELQGSSLSLRDIMALPCPGGPTPTPTPLPTRRPPPTLEAWTVPTPDPTLQGWIAFSSDMDSQGDWEIYVMMTNGSGLTRLTNNTAGDWSPCWSPDGSMLAFGSNLEDEQNGDIYVMNSDGSGITRLTSDPAFDSLPDWSPDGSRIAFVSQRDDHQDDIYVMNADGTGQTNLTSNPDTDSYPAWSPDGSQIAFASRRDGNYEIYVMDADGGNQRRLTDDPAGDYNPAWSPDGKKIAFSSRRDGNLDIYVIDADGYNVSRLTDNPADDSYPVWSPDGVKIAFTSDRDGGREIYVMNADGTGQARLTNNSGEDYISDWIP